MKLCADENVAPKMSELIRQQLLSPSNTLLTIDDYQASGVDDEIWVRKFADDGGDAVIGGDLKMTQRPSEIVAIAETGLRIVILDPRWARSPKHIQISYLFYWWPEIEKVLAGAGRGKCFKVPWGWPERTDGAIKPISIDVQGAYKKKRKAKK